MKLNINQIVHYFFLSFIYCIVTYISSQIDLPITYDDSSVYYTLIPFGDDEGSSEIIFNSNIDNYLAYVTKSSSAATWAGVTIG